MPPGGFGIAGRPAHPENSAAAPEIPESLALARRPLRRQRSRGNHDHLRFPAQTQESSMEMHLWQYSSHLFH